MKRFFVAIDQLDLKKEQKIRLFLSLRIGGWALFGGVLYLLFGDSWEECLLLMGYSSVINGFFVSAFYLFRNDFT